MAAQYNQGTPRLDSAHLVFFPEMIYLFLQVTIPHQHYCRVGTGESFTLTLNVHKSASYPAIQVSGLTAAAG